MMLVGFLFIGSFILLQFMSKTNKLSVNELLFIRVTQ